VLQKGGGAGPRSPVSPPRTGEKKKKGYDGEKEREGGKEALITKPISSTLRSPLADRRGKEEKEEKERGKKRMRSDVSAGLGPFPHRQPFSISVFCF